jgi:hypothetical protein
MNIPSIGQPAPGYPKPASNTPSLNPAPDSGAKEDVEAEFLAYARMSPAERMRDNILKSMGLTENDVNAMSPADRQKLEDKIKELIKQQMEEAAKKKGQLLDVAV